MTRPLHVYLAGPMTGIAEFNFPAFDAAAAKLRDLGYVVFNPPPRQFPLRADRRRPCFNAPHQPGDLTP